MTIRLINYRDLYDSAGNELNFAISAKSAPVNLQSNPVINYPYNVNGNPIQYNVSYPFSVFPSGSTQIIEITMDFIDSGRFYFAYGQMPLDASGNIAPLPLGDQYYGWIEFSRLPTDNCVWINLSNVDLVGLPLALSGSSGWSLGYKKSINNIVNKLSSTFSGAVISVQDFRKVIGPNIIPSAYTTFDSFFDILSQNNAQLCINTDTLSDGTQKQFKGGFNNELGAIILSSSTSDNLIIYYSAITSDIIYRCDGASLYYNGVEYPENRSGNTDSVITTNSLFRNILIGLNEGYFEVNPSYSNNINYSVNYSYLKPFGVSGHTGNMYAKILHETSNSYGFPYADSNLKTLIQAPLNDLISLNIIDDNLKAYCYQNDEEATQNSPGSGFYQFGFGADCGGLGNVNIGNCNYPASTNISGTGGFLPFVTEYVPMIFNLSSKEQKYIWINPSTLDYKMVDSDGNACLIYSSGASAIPQINDITNTAGQVTGQKLTWGGGISWNPKANSAVKQ